MAIDIFISVGRTFIPEQEKFVQEIEAILRANGLNPRAVGRNDFTSEQPLKFIQSLISKCSGTVIVAFERVLISAGTEKRGSADQKSLNDARIPTVWNQIEAGMAYQRGHPMLVILEDGLRQEGLLEEGYDWWVQRVPMRPDALRGPEFMGVLSDWKNRVQAFAEHMQREPQAPTDVSNRPLYEILKSLTPSQVWSLVVAIAVSLSAVGTIAFKLGMLSK